MRRSEHKFLKTGAFMSSSIKVGYTYLVVLIRASPEIANSLV